MKSFNKQGSLRLSLCKLIFLLIFLSIFFLSAIIGVFFLSKNALLPFEKEELTLFLSAFTGLIGAGISGSIVLYIAKEQLSCQNSFNYSKSQREHNQFFLQFYIMEISKYEELHKQWIEHSDHLIKYASKLTPLLRKQLFREVRDPLVLMERFHSLLVEEDFDHLLVDYRTHFHHLHRWLIEKNSLLDRTGEAFNLGEEYFSLFYKPINKILDEITDKLMKMRKSLVLELKKPL